MQKLSGQLLEQLRSSRAEHVPRLAEIAVRAKGKRDEVVTAEYANERRDLGRLDGDFGSVTSFEHLSCPLDRLEYNAELGADDVDVERSVGLRVAIDGDALEVHQKAGEAPFSTVDDLLQDGLKHGVRR